MMLMDTTSRGRTTAFGFVNVRILETMCAPSGLGDMSTVGSFPAKHQSRRDNTLLLSLPDRGGFFWWYDRHGLVAQHAFPFGFGKPPECSFIVFFSLLPMHFICVAARRVKTLLGRARRRLHVMHNLQLRCKFQYGNVASQYVNRPTVLCTCPLVGTPRPRCSCQSVTHESPFLVVFDRGLEDLSVVLCGICFCRTHSQHVAATSWLIGGDPVAIIDAERFVAMSHVCLVLQVKTLALAVPFRSNSPCRC